METKVYTGWLEENNWGESRNILYLTPTKGEAFDGEVLALILEADLVGKYVSVRYHIIDKEMVLDEAEEHFLKRLYGVIETDVGHHYSEITGYLWTDEKINIGGHNLIAELHSWVGKFMILIIDIEAD